jgi:hypothetical protein
MCYYPVDVVKPCSPLVLINIMASTIDAKPSVTADERMSGLCGGNKGCYELISVMMPCVFND